MDTSLAILVVDDSKVDRTLLANMFSGSYSLLEARSGREALEIMAHEKVDVVVLDIGMEGMDGFEVISAMKADPALAGVPIVVETSEHAHEEASLLAGADDFIVKPFNPVVVRKRVENIVIKHVLERERLQMEVQKNELLASRRASELLFAAEHDSLTGLYNRSAFFRKTAAYLAERPSEDYTVVQFDIERFKVINELYGSEKGDEVLLAIAGALRESVQDIGTYGRMEADRFAMCLPRAYATEKAFEQPLAAALERTGLDRQIVLCYGMYEVVDRSMPVDIMCDRANLALRSIKGNYNEHLALYDGVMHQAFVAERELLDEGGRALLDGQFEPFIQPIFDLSTGKLASAEALVRWRHPAKGLVAPGAFMPFFENNGFIVKLDGYIRESVCKILFRMAELGIECPPVSVNVSRLEFYDPNLCQNLIDLVTRYGIDPSKLRLEITESAYADNMPQLLEAMDELQRFGFTVLMDDFGAGYSSLSMLCDVSVDMIKLDMRFLSHEDEGVQSRERNILQAIIPMAKSLGLPIIAEGVETGGQASFLKKVGCDFVQGYLYARPLPQDEYIALVSDAVRGAFAFGEEG